MGTSNLEAQARSSASDASPRETAIPLPLFAAQQEIWLAHQFDLANPRYNCGAYLAISGGVDARVLEHAIALAIQECEALRTRFAYTADGPR